jgi:hypothetical protein
MREYPFTLRHEIKLMDNVFILNVNEHERLSNCTLRHKSK